ncbi:MAG: uroporphyrinogen-III synthase [Rhizobiaceae bacterium]|nr:uroporphyrinogen-III synthase [Rhizobiaceae bacterium]
MRVVVTRPAHQGERTARRLNAMGHEAVLLPLSRPLHDAEAARQALSLTAGAIVATSAEAIRTLAELGELVTPHRARPLFAVGKATAEEAANIGFSRIFVSEGSGGELADMIADSLATIPNAPLLYLTGSPRAAGFETRLAEFAVPLEIVECYRMEDIQPDEGCLRQILFADHVDAILFYSRQTALRFFNLTFTREHPDALSRSRFLCLSDAIGETVPERLRAHIEIAAMPDEDSLLALLARD